MSCLYYEALANGFYFLLGVVLTLGAILYYQHTQDPPSAT